MGHPLYLQPLLHTIKRNIGDLYVATLAFGSSFNSDKRQSGDSDIDLAIVVEGILDRNSLSRIRECNAALGETGVHPLKFLNS